MSKKTVKIENKEAYFKSLDKKEKYGELILICLESTGVQGLTIGQMESRFDLVKKIRTELKKKEIIVDIDDYNTIYNSVLSFRWMVYDTEIKVFKDYLKKML